MTGLELRGVSVDYPPARAHADAIHAVRDVSLTVDEREIVALVGPSGCGKSSLLGAIAGVVPCSGRILWRGEDVSGVPVHLRRFGLVFQDGQLFPHLSVARNIAFGLEMAGVAPPAREARVRELLALVGLEGAGDRGVEGLSGGERQRVALARSLAPSPRLLLLDEPLSSLDADLRARLGAEVRDVLRATGTTAIVVTHDAREARLMADRTVRMREGRLTSDGRRARR